MKRKLTFLLFSVLVLLFSVPSSAFAQDNIIQLPTTLELSGFAYDKILLDIYFLCDEAIEQNLFLPLLDYDTATQSIKPYLVQSYSVSEDGLVYTFVLRSDVPWVRFRNGEVIAVRPVTAEDAVTALQQRCSSTDYRSILYRVIKGCNGSTANASGIQAVDDTTFTITVTEPASYIPALLTEPRNAPAPTETVRVNVRTAYTPENLLTNANYVLQSIKQGEPTTFVFVRNPLIPADLQGSSNIERVLVHVFTTQENNNPFNWFEAGTGAFLRGVGGAGLTTLAGPPTQSVRVLIFNPDKEPFDNPQVRRAFSAAIDRTQMGFVPAAQLAPEGVSGALPASSDRVLGFDPIFAADQLAAAGYPDCQGFPKITIKISEYNRQQMDQLTSQFSEVLGCTAETFEVTEVSFDELYRTVSGDALAPLLPGQVPSPTNASRPNLWITNTNAFFPDQASYIGFSLDCEHSSWGIPCGDEQTLIHQAYAEQNPEARTQIWQSVEEAFFGRNGTFPVAPLEFIGGGFIISPWVEGNPVSYYGTFGNWRNINVDNRQWMQQRNLEVELPEPSTSVAPGETATGTISGDISAVVFTIQPSEEGEISLNVSPTDQSDLDPMVNVYDEAGNLIAFNDDADFSTLGVRVKGLPTQTELKVVVYAFNGTSQGDFTLRVGGAALTGTISGDGSVNVRSGPGTNYGVVTTAQPGTAVEITGRNADSSWLAVRIDGQDGWLASFLVTTSDDISGLPVVQ